MSGDEPGLDGGIAGNIRRVRERMDTAARASGRAPEDITLVAISKFQPDSAVKAAWKAGVRVFGENRVQEAKAKVAAVGEGPEWHMVGRLQTNKAKDAARLFGMVQSVDREELALALDRAAEAAGRPLRTLIQVNVTGADRQGGAPPAELPNLIEKMSKLTYLRICGLMAIGPYPAGEGEIRRAYREVRRLWTDMKAHGGEGFTVLSMGMSGDFAWAIEEGSNLVRIGTAIFGDRRGT